MLCEEQQMVEPLMSQETATIVEPPPAAVTENADAVAA